MAWKVMGMVACIIFLSGAVQFAAAETSPSVSGDALGVELHLPGGSPLVSDAGRLVMITGFWHVLEFDVPPQDEPYVRVGLSGPGDQRYGWTYDGEAWTDVEHGVFIDGANCSYDGGHTVFRLAVDPSAEAGTGHLAIESGDTVLDMDVELRERTGGVGFSAPDFFLTARPYTEGVLDSALAGQYVRIHNEGPVPADVRFRTRDENMEMTPHEALLPAFSSASYSISYSTGSLTPQIRNLSADALITYRFMGPSMGMMRLVPTLSYPFRVTLFVGDPNLMFEEEEGYVFQYVRSTRLLSNRTGTLPLVLDGSGDLVLDVECVDCRVLHVRVGGQSVNLPIRVEDGTIRIEEVYVEVAPDIPEGEAYLVYHLNGNEYRTVIEVAPSTEHGAEEEPGGGAGAEMLNKMIPAAIILILVMVKVRGYFKRKGGRR